MSRRYWTPATALVGLFLVVLVAIVVVPAAEKGTSFSSYSAGADGMRLGRDLVARLGWQPEARVVPFNDSIGDPAPVQILINARVSAREARALLEFVRGGGSMLVAGAAGALDDSLPLVAIARGAVVPGASAGSCRGESVWEAAVAQFREVQSIGWRRPAPLDTVGFGRVRVGSGAEAHDARAAVGYPMGKGRIVGVADATFLVNDMLRRCELEADVGFVRMIEYLSRGDRGQRLQYDEYRHGYGVRGGSFAAIRMYLSGASSGRMLAQVAIGGLLLLFAFAPRPLDPRDPVTVARRSPLEHADALAHAYSSVNATRTATSRLLAGVRRRLRHERFRARDADQALVSAAAAVSPEAAAAGELVTRALDSRLPDHDLPAVAAAVATVEKALTQRTFSHHR